MRRKLLLEVYSIIWMRALVKEGMPGISEAAANGLGGIDQDVYEVDPLRCPDCRGEMEIISFIDNSYLSVFDPSKVKFPISSCQLV